MGTKAARGGVLGRGAPRSRALLALLVGLRPDSWGWRGKQSPVPSCPGPWQPEGSCSQGSGAHEGRCDASGGPSVKVPHLINGFWLLTMQEATCLLPPALPSPFAPLGLCILSPVAVPAAVLRANEGGEGAEPPGRQAPGSGGLLAHHADLGTLVKVAVTQVCACHESPTRPGWEHTHWVPHSWGRATGQAGCGAGAVPESWAVKGCDCGGFTRPSTVITPLVAPHLWAFPSWTRWLPPGLHSVSVAAWREARPGTGPFPSHPCCLPLQEGSPSLDLVLSPALPYCKGNDRMSHGKRAASCTSWDLLASCELSGLRRAMGK